MQNSTSYSSLDTLLPWSSSAKEDRRFNILVIIFLILLLIASFWVKNVQLPKVDRKQLEALPPSIAKIIIKKKEELKRKPIEIVKPVTEVAKRATETPKPDVAKPAEVEKPAAVTKSSKPAPTTAKQATVAQVAHAREVAKSSGLLAMKDDLAAMRSAFAPKSLGSGGGGNGGIKVSTALGNSGVGVSRSQIVGAGTGGSGGISVASGASSGLGGGSGGGIGSGRGGGSGRGDSNVDSNTLGGAIVDTGGDVAKAISSSKSGSRGEESIRSILDQNKAALYAIYNRALRENPALQGKVVFKLVIEPDGSVSSCSIVSSELDDAALGNKLVSRMKFISFGADNVTATTTQWAIDFLPN